MSKQLRIRTFREEESSERTSKFLISDLGSVETRTTRKKYQPLNWLTTDGATENIEQIIVDAYMNPDDAEDFFNRSFPKLSTLTFSLHDNKPEFSKRFLENFSKNNPAHLILFSKHAYDIQRLAPTIIPILSTYKTLQSLTIQRKPTQRHERANPCKKISDHPNFEQIQKIVKNLTNMEELNWGYNQFGRIELKSEQLQKIRNGEEVYLTRSNKSYIFSPMVEGPGPAPAPAVKTEEPAPVPFAQQHAKPSVFQTRSKYIIPFAVGTIAAVGATLTLGLHESTASTCAPYILGSLAALLLIALIVTITYKTKPEPTARTFSMEQKPQGTTKTDEHQPD